VTIGKRAARGRGLDRIPVLTAGCSLSGLEYLRAQHGGSLEIHIFTNVLYVTTDHKSGPLQVIDRDKVGVGRR